MAPAVPTLEPRPTLAIEGSDQRFPVRRGFCIGRNYAAHALEMGGNPDKEPPFFFMKTAEAIFSVPPGTAVDLPYPPMTKDFHFEAELVVVLGRGGRNIAEIDALAHVFGVAAGLDMTRRDLQNEAKKMGRPWEVAKSADFSGPVGLLKPFIPGILKRDARITLSVDGVVKQDASLAHMIWSIEQQIAILSQYFEMRAGDVIFTGTPDGVGAVKRGETMKVHIDGLSDIELKVV